MMARWLSRNIGCAGPHLCLCTTAKQFNKVTKALKVPSLKFLGTGGYAQVDSLENEKGDLVCIVSIDLDGLTRSEVVGLLAHEATHCWQSLAKHIGEDNPGSEQEAYAIQSITQTLYREYRRIHKK